MSKVKYFLRENKHLYIVLYYAVVWILYRTFNQNIEPKYFLWCKLDDYIPFVKQMVIPYVMWYGYIFLPLVYMAFNSSDDFIDLCVFMFGGMTICFIIFALFPNGQNLRPNIEVTDTYTYIINRIYSTDNPTNSLPSMHVLNSVAIHCAIARCNKLRKIKWIYPVSLVLMILISASTVMIKQHSILDVFAATVLSYTLYVVIYKLNVTQSIKNRVALDSSKSLQI